MVRTLIGSQDLARHLDDPLWRVVDCRFSLLDPPRGRADHARGHVPGAVYADLDADLSAPVQPGRTGRHPLPDVARLAERLGGWGIDEATQVVAYDDGSGGIAARLWWLLRWLGHEAVAVLDGGWAAWTAEGLPVDDRVPSPSRRRFHPAPRSELVLQAAEAARWATDGRHCLLDAREAIRYRGEAEPIDAVAGHIPGALSAPYLDNLGPDGRWLPAAALARRYAGILGPHAAADCAVYCGSGVTAAHDVLAMVHAGLGEPRLYAGSWSEWITDPARKVATG
ncbi:MAG: sulfurtransferase [Ardenticatenia bacterium]|nr:sulfurtransferase [Ardenticatenia bacterium]